MGRTTCVQVNECFRFEFRSQSILRRRLATGRSYVRVRKRGETYVGWTQVVIFSRILRIFQSVHGRYEYLSSLQWKVEIRFMTFRRNAGATNRIILSEVIFVKVVKLLMFKTLAIEAAHLQQQRLYFRK